MQASSLPGMYVRLPAPDDMEREDGEYRDFRIGQIVRKDDLAQTATILLHIQNLDGSPAPLERDYPLRLLHRCLILPYTVCTHIPTGRPATLLAPCETPVPAGTLCSYYVHMEGQVQTLSEAAIAVPATRQDPDPITQLRHYELHNPIWRQLRDQVLEGYHELHNASFGIEDLIGSRVMLLPHQAEVITHVLNSTTCRFMLADEVGLGKTIEACIILKGLRRRNPSMQTLIIAPSALVQQWHNELSAKCWLDFVIVRPRAAILPHSPGVIISTEDVAQYAVYWEWLTKRTWNLLIVDEAHHLRKIPLLFARVQELSQTIERVLLLTATPIQRHADEYLALLALLDPSRYATMDKVAFDQLLAAQTRVRQAIVYLQPNLTEDTFAVEEFLDEIDSLAAELHQDRVLPTLIDEVRQHAPDVTHVIESAKAVVAYISENYRIERRIIRNRRASLTIPLPVRELDDTWSYTPLDEEHAALDELANYLDFMLAESAQAPVIGDYCRSMLHAAASSPHALLDLLEQRYQHLTSNFHQSPTPPLLAPLPMTASPRQDAQYIQQVLQAIPTSEEEKAIIHHTLWYVRQWLDQTDQELAALSRKHRSAPKRDSHHRLVHVLHYLSLALAQDPTYKVVVFTRWARTRQVLVPLLEHAFHRQALAQFHAEMDQAALQQAVDRFQADDTCRILLCDELGGEGRNFQIADALIHIDIPWTPAHLEQRIGRVDRLGRTGTVVSVVPFAQERIEHDLFRIWQEAFQLFTRSLSGMELALEGIQDELTHALAQSTRQGLATILPQMITRADLLREEVEEERYFEAGAMNYRFRQEFETLSARYRDGAELRTAFLPWAKLAGLTHSYQSDQDTVIFYPKQFNHKSLANAKFLPPNMEEANRRSPNKNTLIITGTFNRDKAVQREDLVFFAPSDDPWTDAIIANALEADRGRCCAIQRIVPDLAQDWQGFALFYRLYLDPRPLYAAGYAPTHLFRAQGFLVATTHRVLISSEGQILKRSHPIWKALQAPFKKTTDKHLGKREPPHAQLPQFKERYPQDVWQAMIDHVVRIADTYMQEEYAFTEELATEAQQEFAQYAAGWRASSQWFLHRTGEQLSVDVWYHNHME
jgi:ERCC4-related helicase